MDPFFSFLVVAAVATVVPGPDTFVVLRTAVTDGSRAGAWAAGGSATGNLLWGAATVAGLTALLAGVPAVFAVLQLAGAAYLGLLGVQALVAAHRGTSFAPVREGERSSRSAAFRRGLGSDLLNVKVGLFWTALVPQFVTADSDPLLPVAMVAAMALLVFSWLSASAVLAGRLGTALSSPTVSRALNGAVGVVLVGLAARLALLPH